MFLKKNVPPHLVTCEPSIHLNYPLQMARRGNLKTVFSNDFTIENAEQCGLPLLDTVA
jgi:hypothetical protein